MRAINIILTVLAVLSIVIALAFCDYQKTEPAPMIASSTTTAAAETSVKVNPTTTTASVDVTVDPETTTTTQLVVPEGFIRCPECGGERKVCEYCNGTDKRKAEKMDPDTGVYVRYYENCNMCSFEDPGYYYCKTCHNQLIIPK